MARPSKLSKEQWSSLITDYNKGASIRELATFYNISKTVISDELKAYGIETRPVGQPKSTNPYESLEIVLNKLEQRYNAGEITETQMASEYIKFVNEYERRQDMNYYKNNESLESLNHKQLQQATANMPKPASVKGEIYDDMMKAVLEQLQDGTITKPEALKRYLHIDEEFESLGIEDFEAKYKDVYPELKDIKQLQDTPFKNW